MLRPLRQRSDLYREKPLATAWTIEGVKEALAAKKISARELLADFYRRIEARNPELNAYLALTPERARRQAERIDALVAAGGPLPPLAGVPMAIKDVISTRGTKATCGSKILENYIPPYDATAVERLEAAGAVLLGKTNCDEFAMGSSNENSAYGPVKNPLAPDRVPGGSSGGSAAVVAAGLAVASLGTDTGGSIRQPGSFCGIPAMMGSYGRVSRYGLIAFASSLDRIGPFARTVEDAAMVLGVIAGHDPLDATSSERPVPDYVAECKKPVEGLRVGVPAEYFAEGVDAEVKRRILLGTYVLSAGYYDAYYRKAQQVRRVLAEDFLKAFTKVDVIVTPTAPTPAFRIGEKTDDPVSMYLADIYTVTASLAGICGVSVPCGVSSEGLPIGAQVLGPHFGEGTAFRA